jgi:serine/threonine-protein kinase HipA
MNGSRVAYWTISPNGHDQLRYDEEWLKSERQRPLSLSLPLQTGVIRTAAVGAYFDNLLPDSDPIRKRLQARFGTATRGAFDLLEAIGQDCVGAVQLMPLGSEPGDYRKTEATPLTEAKVAQVLRDTILPSGGIHREDQSNFRISIAGAQEKTALTVIDGQWCLPHGATPTTHIFKLPLGLVGARKADMRTSVENEWLCAQLLDLFGIPVAETAIATFEDQKALLVTRFDRQRTAEGYWLRLPQEDFCQALGCQRAWARGNRRKTGVFAQWPRPGELFPYAGPVLDVGGNRWPRQKLLDPAATGFGVRNDADVRRAFCLAGDRAGGQFA